jgi:hypothetical protein
MYTDLHALSSRGMACFDDTEEVKEERKSLEYTLMSSEVIQMINRVSCRRVIDEKGNCPDTEVYLTLPKKEPLSNTIINDIKEQMPGIVIKKDWGFLPKKSKKTGPKSKYEEPFIDYLINNDKNKIKFAEVASLMNLKDGVLDSLRKRLKAAAAANSFISLLNKSNIRFCKEGGSWVFIKE